MTDKPTDAVAQALEMILFCINDPHFKAEDADECHWDGMPWPCPVASHNTRREERIRIWLYKYRDALIAAVRAECAAKEMGLVILDQSGNVICRNVEDGCAWEIVDALDAAFPPEAPHSLWNYAVSGHWKVERNANTLEAP